ncbi:MAG: hypothetical protein A3H28_15400 [Acidobacteria bacterium RIFCSPLOWO2_02_FULL_61_28]|nr:MAG: hypothetical protein A3H28_15400 [Acidobacteria bacterium RIFCSPLOWO2_02_FULL_61_28]
MVIRAVVPRTDIKEIKKVIAKIEDKKENRRGYGLSHLEDLVGVKIFCPYATDVRQVIDSMRNHEGFIVPETNREARRKTKAGYRGFHFTLQLKGPLLVNNEDLTRIKCEVQVKTMLEEAWDAKTHDITYKSESVVDQFLLGRMGEISEALAAFDKRSEELKKEILKRHTEERKRKEAVASVYLSEAMPLWKEVLSELQDGKELRELRARNFNAKNVLRLIPPIEKRRDDKNLLSPHLCRLAGLVALYARGQHIDIWALDLCDDLIHKDPQLSRPYLVKGSVCWALDQLDEALEVTKTGIEKAEEENDQGSVANGKANFAYWVGEKVWNASEKDTKLASQAIKYIDEAIRSARKKATRLSYSDTKGFLLITTGKNAKEIRKGMRLIREVRRQRTGGILEKLSRLFFDRHISIAKQRLALLKTDG